MQTRPPHKDKTVIQTKSELMNEFEHFRPEEPQVYDNSFFTGEKAEIKALRKLSFLAGSAVLLYILIQNLIFTAVELLGLLELYKNNLYFGSGIDILMTVLGVYLPFSLVGRKMKIISEEKEPILSEMPHSSALLIFGVLGATGCVMLANILSSYITYFISLLGFELSSPDLNLNGGFTGFALSMLRISILTAVVEEYSLRGHVLGNLRKYGDGFAVIMSATIFALMHGTLIQVPFAMLSGIALAVFTLKSRSIWPAIIAHAINNGLSVIITYLIDIMGEDAAMVLYSFAIYVFIFIGMVATFVFSFITRNRPLRKSRSVLKPLEKAFHFLFTPPALIALVIMIIITATSVTKIA